MHDLFALTDEQILEIEPVVADGGAAANQTASAGNASRVAPASLPAGASPQQQSNTTTGGTAPQANAARSSTNHDSTVLDAPEPPAWLAAQMKDPWGGEEAREFWNGVQQARTEAAAYRAAFATPEDARALKVLYPGGVNEARAAAERARVLDDFDRAYFGAAG